MQINNLPASNITVPKGTVSAPDPMKPSNGAKPAVAPVAKAPAPKPAAAAAAPPVDKKDTSGGAEAVAAAKAGEKTEVTEVKPTGEETAGGEPTFTLKVNGQDIVATQSQIIALAQKAKGAEFAMKRTAEIEKLTADLLENFDKDAFGLMVKRHGKDKAKEMAIAMVRNLIAEEEKTPEQVELEESRAKLKTYEEEKAAAKKVQEDEARRVKQNELYRTLLTDIDTALNATHLPKDKLTLTRVLNYLAAGKKSNGQTWTVKDAVQAVEMEDMGHATHYSNLYLQGKLPSEKFRAIFGDDAIKKLNKEQIELLKNADKSAKKGAAEAGALDKAAETPVTKRRTLSRNKGSEGISEREYRKQFGSIGGI